MILSLNTATVQFSMALLEEDGSIAAEYFVTPGSKGYNRFMPALDDLLTRSSCEAENIKTVIVATGPGSFTGLRVGLSTAKGFWRNCFSRGTCARIFRDQVRA